MPNKVNANMSINRIDNSSDLPWSKTKDQFLIYIEHVVCVGRPHKDVDGRRKSN